MYLHRATDKRQDQWGLSYQCLTYGFVSWSDGGTGNVYVGGAAIWFEL